MKLTDKISVEKAHSMSPIVLAFIGDAVMTLFVRQKIAYEKDYKSGKLNELASKVVCAEAQSKLADAVFPQLTNEEQEVFRRARNAKKPSHAKNASITQYNKSTGLEAVIGFLYVTGNEERLHFILNFGGGDNEG